MTKRKAAAITIIIDSHAYNDFKICVNHAHVVPITPFAIGGVLHRIAFRHIIMFAGNNTAFIVQHAIEEGIHFLFYFLYMFIKKNQFFMLWFLTFMLWFLTFMLWFLTFMLWMNILADYFQIGDCYTVALVGTDIAADCCRTIV